MSYDPILVIKPAWDVECLTQRTFECALAGRLQAEKRRKKSAKRSATETEAAVSGDKGAKKKKKRKRSGSLDLLAERALARGTLERGSKKGSRGGAEAFLT